jgi:hypothetical protein
MGGTSTPSKAKNFHSSATSRLSGGALSLSDEYARSSPVAKRPQNGKYLFLFVAWSETEFPCTSDIVGLTVPAPGIRYRAIGEMRIGRGNGSTA